MKIFELLQDLKGSIDKFEKDYDKEYVNGYNACLSDIEGRLMDAIELEIKLA